MENLRWLVCAGNPEVSVAIFCAEGDAERFAQIGMWDNCKVVDSWCDGYAEAKGKLDFRGTIDEHILLYSKHWYGHSGDPVSDIAEIICERSNITEIGHSEVMEMIAAAFIKCIPILPDTIATDSLAACIRPDGWGRTDIEALLGGMSYTEVDNFIIEMNNMMSIRFGDKAVKERAT